jgi:hypothetical protein
MIKLTYYLRGGDMGASPQFSLAYKLRLLEAYECHSNIASTIWQELPRFCRKIQQCILLAKKLQLYAIILLPIFFHFMRTHFQQLENWLKWFVSGTCWGYSKGLRVSNVWWGPGPVMNGSRLGWGCYWSKWNISVAN